ncbi:SH3 domain-containing protein [Pyruvatibacter mobilis]|uniref:SH3 domain-containing protein n=1 Tax=Pyruvatibacter mobilis TaxID=1712261 RepID=UPI003BB1EF15
MPSLPARLFQFIAASLTICRTAAAVTAGRTWSARGAGIYAMGIRTTGIVLAVALTATAGPSSLAQPARSVLGGAQLGPVTGLPMPRFVSIKSSPVNVRGGPSTNHQVAWVFVRRGVPVEVTAEFENWRRIRDVDGDQGWVFHTLIDGERMVMVVGPDKAAPREGDLAKLHFAPDGASDVVALVEPGVIGTLVNCGQGWCAVRMGPHEGFMRATSLYGIYEREAG